MSVIIGLNTESHCGCTDPMCDVIRPDSGFESRDPGPANWKECAQLKSRDSVCHKGILLFNQFIPWLGSLDTRLVPFDVTIRIRFKDRWQNRVVGRSEERRVGKGCVSRGVLQWVEDH